MSEKNNTPATVGPPAPPAPSNSQKVTKRRRPRGGKKIRPKGAEKALLAVAEAGSVAGTEVAARPASYQAPSLLAASPPQATSTGVAAPAVGLAHQITIASLVPGLNLSEGEVHALAAYLPHIIAGFVQGRRAAGL